MATPKYQATVKVYSATGTRLEVQGTRIFALRGIWNMMTPAERKAVLEEMTADFAKEA